MKLLWVKGKNFRAFRNVSWTLPTSGLHLIDGIDLGTDRSNMVGKSTLMDLAFWVAYAWLPKWGGPKGGSADSVIHRGEKSCWGEACWKVGQDTLVVKRNRPSGLSVTVNGSPVDSKDLQRVIEGYLHSPARYLRTVYLSQNRNEEAATKSFFTMSDTERTELLSIVAGLEELDQALIQSKIDRDTVEKELLTLSGKLDAQKARLLELPIIEEKRRNEYVEACASAESAELSLIEVSKKVNDELDILKRASDIETKKITQVEQSELAKIIPEIEKATARYREIEKAISSSPQPEPQLLTDIDVERKRLEFVRQYNKDRQKIERDNQKLSDRFERLTQEVSDAENGKCSKCTQDLPQWSKEEAVASKLSEAKLVAQQIKELPELMDEDDTAYQSALGRLSSRKAELDAQPAKLRAELAAQKALLSELTSKSGMVKQTASSKRGNLIVELEGRRTAAKRLIADKERDIQVATQSHQKAATELANALEEADASAKLVEETEKLIEVKSFLKDVAMDLVDLFGPKGYRTVRFDGLIGRIGARAGQLLGLMTDGLYSTSIVQAGTDAKGNSKAVLKTIVTKGGLPVPPDDLSGGARQHCILGYDVAVSDAAGEGAPLFLDEALDGLDMIGKQEAMVMFEEISRTRPVFLIDHSSECKASFTSVIAVEHSKGVSRLIGDEEDANN
jgi:DNA repair exonuclease SbcCD ATPase subunit